MCIVNQSSENPTATRKSTRIEKQRVARKFGLNRLHLVAGMVLLSPGAVAVVHAYNIDLPSIGATTYNVTVSNSKIDGGAVATVGANDTTVINDFLAYAAANGGGTVEIPGTGTFEADELFIGNGTNLQVNSGATLENLNPKAEFINTLAGTSQNVEISGGGIINDNATSTSGNHMVLVENITNLEVYDVTIENASNEHLIAENDSNVLINDVTITDSKIQSNTDGVDFSGSNFLIENCTIHDGDDDIVLKPESTVCSNIYIQNCTITDGHGISVGGQTQLGLNGLFVNNCTINMATQSNANGIDLKSGAGQGGHVENVTFNNININDVDDGLVISSYYTSGGDEKYPSIPAPVYTPGANEPFWSGITIENIKVNDVSGNAANIYGLNASTPNETDFNFVNDVYTNSGNWKMFYANNVYINGLSVNGTTIADALGNYKNSSGDEVSQEADDTFVTSANPIYTVAVPTLVAGSDVEALVINSVPEPGTLALAGAAGLMLLSRRRQAHPKSEST
ncbi:MAG: glycosyl hydrolase family 28 protein [Tepidisphaeraceae bacterium]|jgi:polygalacturonase